MLSFRSLSTVCGGILMLAAVSASAQPYKVEVSPAVAHGVSGALRDIPVSPSARTLTERPLRPIPNQFTGQQPEDTALQVLPSPSLLPPTLGLNFAGVGQGDYGFDVQYAPPDTNGAVGETQYVQWVNARLAVFNKTTGSKLMGPTPGNQIWTNLKNADDSKSPCATNNDGDPIVLYDKIAKRWILTQFSISTKPYLQCVAVSKTSDATGDYHLYAFSYGNTQFPDYPKLGVWPDGYYITFNIFNNGTTFAGPKVCAYDRDAMLAGQQATQQCFQLPSNYGSVLPSDFDGTALPPSGAPNVMISMGGSGVLNTWQFKVNSWGDTPSATLSGPKTVKVAPFTPACGWGGVCIPQSGTSQKLDSLGDRLMHRFSYRNFGTYESRLVNHTVSVGASRKSTTAGVRWYELRGDPASLSVHQQGSYSPDSTYRWMGSIAQDKSGNIALGYSASSSVSYPSIRIATRLLGDTLGTLGDEMTVQAGAGSQLRNLSRWGDYSAMTVDPVDDCTFWYTNQYLKSSGTFNWSTRIQSFTLGDRCPK